MEDKKTAPEQTKGNYSGAEEIVVARNRMEAIELFTTAKKRLLNINSWHIYSGHKAATFLHLNKYGEPISRMPATGDYIRIDLPGPGPNAGNGYDWVRVDVLHTDKNPQQDEDYCAIRVRPSHEPGRLGIAHFFTSEATSTFVVKRKGLTVTAAEIGRNEVANTKTRTWFDKIRNKLFATAASYGLSHIQWKTLVKGFLQRAK